MANITEGIRSMVDKNSFRRWPENDVLNRIFTTLNGARLKAADTPVLSLNSTWARVSPDAVGVLKKQNFSRLLLRSRRPISHSPTANQAHTVVESRCKKRADRYPL